MTRRTVYISTTSFESGDLKTILAACDAHRVDALELSAVSGYERTLLGSTAYPRRFLVHNYFPPPPVPFLLNLASQDPAIHAASVAHCRSSIELSAALGGLVYAAHGGYLAELAPHHLGDPAAQSAIDRQMLVPYERGYTTLLDTVRDLTAFAASRGVRFLIENHVLSALNGPAGASLLPMVRAEELVRLARDVARPGFGVLVDVGHLNVAATTLGFDRQRFIDLVAPHVAAFHLSANDGVTDQHRGFGDEAWFLPRLAEFPDAVITLELSRVPIEELLAVRDIVEARL